jgi:hypothetical protein
MQISSIQAVHHLDAVLLYKANINTSNTGARVHTMPMSCITTTPGAPSINLLQLVQSDAKRITLRLHDQIRATRLYQDDWIEFVHGRSAPAFALITQIEPAICWQQVRPDFGTRERICQLEGLALHQFPHIESHLSQHWRRDLRDESVGRSTLVLIVHFRLAVT